MNACAAATFPDRVSAFSAKRAIKRVYKANTSIFLCGRCDKFHAVVDVGRYPVSESWQRLLRCLSQGMTREEMAAQTGLTPRSVEWALEEMKKRFYALNRPHLVAIAIALGIVDPNSFVPAVEESPNEHCS